MKKHFAWVCMICALIGLYGGTTFFFLYFGIDRGCFK